MKQGVALMMIRWNMVRLFGMLMVSVLLPVQSQALQLSAAQLQMVQQLPASEKAKLAAQAGVTLPSSAPKVAPTDPVMLQPRTVGTGRIEAQINQTTASESQQNKVIHSSANVQVPVAQVTSQTATDQLEVRKAFENFIGESKPMVVDTSHLKLFGYELFAGSPTTFAPATDIPVPAEYVLGPGDELKVQLFGARSDQLSLLVDREGKVSFPDLGPLVLANLSFSEAKALLAQKVSEKMTGVTVSISMGILRSIRVFALGEVYQPGSYVVSGLATLSQALMVSGGVKKTGSLRHVLLKRHGRVVSDIDLYDFLLNGDTSKDVRLLPGDVVFVPPIGVTVGIAGAVLRPAIYELKTKTHVQGMLKLAGGLLPNAFTHKALLEGINTKSRHFVKNLNLKGKGLHVSVHNGDMIKVFFASSFEENPVMLIGNVKRPGKYAWKQGMQVSDLIPSLDDLLPETYMDYAVIEREASGNREPEVVRFRLASLFAQSQVHIALHPRDKVYIFNRSHFRVAPMVRVSGSVKTPGQYALKKNMTILDAVMAAGGLTRDSLLDSAELYRTDKRDKSIRVRKFSLQDVLRGDSLENKALQDMDRIVVHSIWEVKRHNKVSIFGEVKNGNSYDWIEGMHVSDLVFAAGGVTEQAYLKEAVITRYRVVDGEKREVKHMSVNLKAALAGDETTNIMLQRYDVLTVRQLSNWQPVEHMVSIMGQVMHPGVFPITEKMRVVDLLLAAGGVTDQAYLKEAEVTRYRVVDGEKREVAHLPVNLKTALAGDEAANMVLQRYDVLTVRQLSNWRQVEHVTMKGEVLFPGAYPVEDGEHLSSLLKRAGGYTDKAYLRAAVFTRESIRKEQQDKIDVMVKKLEGEVARMKGEAAASTDPKALAAVSSAEEVLAQMRKTKATGRLVLTLKDIDALEGTDFDVRLRDGDALYVPKKPDQVLVLGQVYNTTAMLYEKGMSVDDYIQRSGGMTRYADESHIYVVHASGIVEPLKGSWGHKLKLYPGDAIMVPEDLEQFNWIGSLLDWSKIMYQFGTALASMRVVGLI